MNNDTPSLSNITVPGWITEAQLSQRLQVSTRHLINLRRCGLPFIQLGNSVRYDLEEVERYLRTNRRLSSHVTRQQRRKVLEAR